MIQRIILKVFTTLHGLHQKSYLAMAKKRGLKVGDNTVFIEVPDFGSEPYLIKIGNDNLITTGVRFITHDGGLFVVKNLPGYEDARNFARIRTGNNVFIGNNCILLPGAKMGNNCVLGAGSVLNSSMPDNCVYAGVPARFISSIEDYAEKSLANTTRFPRDLENDRKKLDAFLQQNLPYTYKPEKKN